MLTNKHSLPEPLVNALRKQRYSRGPANFSVTQVIDSPRVSLLREAHKDEIVHDISDRLWALMGTALHHVLEQGADDEHIPEERLFATVEGITISGGIDLQITGKGNPPTVKLADYKLTSVWSVMNGKASWEQQLNLYAWLVRSVKGWTVEGAEIIAICRDWARREAERKPDYPQAPVVRVPIRLWEPEEADRFVRERVNIHKDAKRAAEWAEALPECTPSERWARPATWAVMKEGRKTAVRVFDNEADARELSLKTDGSFVQERPGENVRCAGDHCSVSRWCDQWKRERGE